MNRYRCSLCQAEVPADQIAEHMAAEKAKPTWPGHMSYTLIGSVFDTQQEDQQP